MLQFQVLDMHCAACVRRVTKAVQGIDPAARIEADAPARALRVDSAADPAALLRALEEAGYPATPAT
ncbi:heavy-metal-associated domain-containing protein [Rubellimicrobium roseum]|uniref:Heavy-metal-associated domain-containing protein n=1 Tax=Rubellimicrobium roseum TaxID=687525 RepID=A0A5C4NQ14_9RHOB|nr:heavy-metal-associated domain-containing protein [Rubellimicrobium roseum]TNC74747.1 heavy-metal-associated domain-containing protein [Rubellimicrobium roseum]